MRKLTLSGVMLCILACSAFAQVRVTSNPSLVAMSPDGYLRGGTVKVQFDQPVFAYTPTRLTIALNRSDLKFSQREENQPQAFVNGDPTNWLSVDVSADHLEIDIRLVSYGVQSITVKGFVIDAIDAREPGDVVTATLGLSDGLTMDLPSVTLLKVRNVKVVR